MNEELSTTVMEELQEQLRAHHQHLETEIDRLQSTEGVGAKQEDDPSIEVRGDQGEASVEIETWAIARQEEVNLREQLAEVEHALSKFALGTYGRCEQCGQPIPLARLRAFPEARYDVAHQAEVEKRVRGL
jgi:DnaK suppressor protein